MIYLEVILAVVFVYHLIKLRTLTNFVQNNIVDLTFSAPDSLKEDIRREAKYLFIVLVFSFLAFVLTLALAI